MFSLSEYPIQDIENFSAFLHGGLRNFFEAPVGFLSASDEKEDYLKSSWNWTGEPASEQIPRREKGEFGNFDDFFGEFLCETFYLDLSETLSRPPTRNQWQKDPTVRVIQEEFPSMSSGRKFRQGGALACPTTRFACTLRG